MTARTSLDKTVNLLEILHRQDDELHARDGTGAIVRLRDGFDLLTSLILPNYNPGPALERTWHDLCQFISCQRTPWEVIFVCDGSTDGTIEQLHQWRQEDKADWCRVLSYSPNRGKGMAVRVGLEAARGAVRVFTDVDLAYTFDDLLRVVNEVEQGAAVAIASREHPESHALLPMSMIYRVSLRRVQSHVFRGIARQIVDIRYADTQAGLKAFSAEAAQAIVPRLACNGFGFDCEVLLACKHLNIPVTEMPITVRYQTAASTTSWKSSFQMLKQIWQIRRRWSKGIPQPAPSAVTVHETVWPPLAKPLARAA